MVVAEARPFAVRKPTRASFPACRAPEGAGKAGATAAVHASEDVVPASHLREAYAKIRELERALGRKTMEVEILRAAQEIVKKTPSLRRESGR